MPRIQPLLLAATICLAAFTGPDTTAKKPAPPPPTVRDLPMNYSFCGPIGAVALNPYNHQHIVVASEMGGLFESKNTGANWTHLSSFKNYLVNDIVLTPAAGGFELWAATSESFRQVPGVFLWKRSVSGNWSQVTLAGTSSSLPAYGSGNTYRVLQHVYTGDMYACGDFGIAIKKAAESSFKTYTLPGAPSVFSIEVMQNGTIIAGTLLGIQVGVPGRFGFTWTLKPLTPKYTGAGDRFALATDATRSIVFAAGPDARNTNFQLWMSADTGSTWQLFRTQPATVVGNAGGLVTINPRYDFTAKELTIYFSNRYEVNYAKGSGATIAAAAAAMRSNASLVWKGKLNSANIAHDDTRHVAMLTQAMAKPKMMITSDGGIHVADITGKEPERFTWNTVGTSSGLKNSEVVTITGDRTNVYFSTWHTGFGATTDGFATWSSGASAALRIFGGEGYVVSMRGQDDLIAPSVMVGPDLKFSKKIFGLDTRDETPWNGPSGNVVSAWGPTFISTTTWIQDGVRAPTATSTPWAISTNNGSSWTNLPSTTGLRFGRACISRTNPTSPSMVYTVGLTSSGGIQLGQLSGFSTPASASWRLAAQTNLAGGVALMGSLNYSTPVFAVNPFNAAEILAIERNTGKLKKSTNNGDNWTELTSFTRAYTGSSGPNLLSNNGIAAVWCIAYCPSDPQKILAGTVTEGMYYSSDGGSTWTNLNNPGILAPTGIYWHNSRTVYVSTYGRGIFEITI